MTAPKIPIESYAESKAYKIYLLDVGLLGTMSFLPPKVIVEGHRLFTEFKGALAENYVAQALTQLFDKRLFYWTSGQKAEVDFILPIDTNFIPLEVKSGENKRKKSLLSYAEKYHPRKILRASPMNFHESGNFLNVPLYAIVPYLEELVAS